MAVLRDILRGQRPADPKMYSKRDSWFYKNACTFTPVLLVNTYVRKSEREHKFIDDKFSADRY